MMIFIVLLIIFVTIVKSDTNTEHKLIETNDGKVRGVRQTTLIKQVAFYSFKGIPYAKSPVGELRFKPPEPIESWSPNTLDAFEYGSTCIQPTESLDNMNPQSEDCLFLNIFLPADVKLNEKLAVLVSIHGGGYGVGSGNDDHLGPDFLIEQRVIVATLNYRLGVFGFMSFGTPEYSGNMGLKDQQLALKWIHSNIEHFSGDNQRITLYGISAGATSAHFHIFSTESRKYFRNIISVSGTVDNYWAMSKGSDHLDYARKITQELGEPKQSTDELIAFFKTVPAANMIEFGNARRLSQRLSQLNLAPVIEPKNADRPFIVDSPNNIYEQSKIDVDALFAFSTMEFLSFYSKQSPELNNFSDLQRNFTLELPFREANLSFDSAEYKKIAMDIREFYFKDAPIDDRSEMQFLKLLSDVNFAYGIDKSARMHANKSSAKTYYYRFAVDSKLNFFKSPIRDGEIFPGASHGGDLCYLFRCSFHQVVYGEVLRSKDDEQSNISLKTIKDLTELVSNFVKYGEPTHDGHPIVGFLPIQSDKINFLDITNDGLKPGVSPNREANDFWANIEQRINADLQRSTCHEL